MLAITADRAGQPGRGSVSTWLAIVLLACCALAVPPVQAADAAAPSDEAGADSEQEAEPSLSEILDASGAVIHEVIIKPQSIFDLENPAENSFFYRLANKLHITTKPQVIAQQMLFAAGDEFSSRLLEESERKLRENAYIQDATIEPLLDEDGKVDVEVDTSDTWTMSPTLRFSRAGGENDSQVGLRDGNLLGRGIHIEALYDKNVDRTSTILKLRDKNVGHTWYRLNLDLEDSDDGFTRSIGFGKPFHALDSRKSQGFDYYDNERIDSYYGLGKIVGQFAHDTRSYDVYRGWSAGLTNGHVTRYTTGLAYDEHRFAQVLDGKYPVVAAPPDRKLVYPFFRVEWLQDDYAETHNLDQISRTEDYFLGTRFTAQLGYASDGFGSDRNSWLVSGSAESGFGDLASKSLFLNASLNSRYERGAVQDLGLLMAARYYDRQSDKWLFFTDISGFYGRHLDADHQLLLGGDSGLRGYPLRYQTGDRSALLTLEQRYFTNWYPFRLVRVGAAVFFDVGRSWGNSPVDSANLGWLRDVGIGLRLGSTRSGLGNMVHIDLAYPLDGEDSIDKLQILVSTKKGF